MIRTIWKWIMGTKECGDWYRHHLHKQREEMIAAPNSYCAHTTRTHYECCRCGARTHKDNKHV